LVHPNKTNKTETNEPNQVRHEQSKKPTNETMTGNTEHTVTPDELVTYTLTINGQQHTIDLGWEGESLLYVLRERLGLPAAKNACEQGECGSCSVLVNGQLVCSCLVMASSAQGQPILTVEGLPVAEDGLTDVQAAFLRAGAVQCGFCTPGLVMAVHDLLEHLPTPTDLEIREAISGNLCRCTGYGRIFEAINEAAHLRRNS
jgi:aerobic carbon-monoxide dehydrogenase small subunit